MSDRGLDLFVVAGHDLGPGVDPGEPFAREPPHVADDVDRRQIPRGREARRENQRVDLRHDPVGGTLEEMNLARRLPDFRHELDRTRRAPDDRDALAKSS